MEHDDINTIYDRISKILKNDQKYSYKKMGELIIDCTSAYRNIEHYYQLYPPLLDVAELGASLEHEENEYTRQIAEQIRYKMQQLLAILPEIK